MNASVEVITPQVAAALLGTNLHNRPLNKRHIAHLANEMRAGRFVETGQSLQISNTNVLLDGQHRLHALIAANFTMPFIVVRSLPDSIFDKLDQGRMRSGGDVLSMAGHGSGTLLAATAKMIMRFDEGQYVAALQKSGDTRISPAEVLAYITAHDLTEALSAAAKYYNINRVYTKSEWGFMHEILGRIDTEQAADFLGQLATGANLDPDDVVLFVRSRLAQAAGSKSMSIAPAVRIEYAFRAWNRVRRGRRQGHVKIGETFEIPK